MTSRTLQFRPILIGADYQGKPFYQKINWTWFLQRIPMFLFAVVASYGVGNLLHMTGIPFPIDWLGAISFDIGFLGAIALADMQLTRSFWSNVFFFSLNISMAILSALFNVLSHAGGKYVNINAEAITVGVPFAIVGLAFAFYYHSVMAQHVQNEIIAQEKEEKILQQTQEPCKYCGEGKPSKQAVYGHYRSCSMKKMHDAVGNTNQCKCLLCK